MNDLVYQGTVFVRNDVTTMRLSLREDYGIYTFVESQFILPYMVNPMTDNLFLIGVHKGEVLWDKLYSYYRF